MKDLLIKVLVSAVVGSIVSAGILYFAFDQSLRGVESAIASQSDRIGDTSEWLRVIDGKVTDLTEKMGAEFNKASQKLDSISTQISASSNQETSDQMMMSTSLLQLQTEMAGSIRTTRELASIWSASFPRESAEYGKFLILIEQMEAHEQALRTIEFARETVFFPKEKPSP